jgi:hypothetical protein
MNAVFRVPQSEGCWTSAEGVASFEQNAGPCVPIEMDEVSMMARQAVH